MTQWEWIRLKCVPNILFKQKTETTNKFSMRHALTRELLLLLTPMLLFEFKYSYFYCGDSRTIGHNNCVDLSPIHIWLIFKIEEKNNQEKFLKKYR